MYCAMQIANLARKHLLAPYFACPKTQNALKDFNLCSLLKKSWHNLHFKKLFQKQWSFTSMLKSKWT